MTPEEKLAEKLRLQKIQEEADLRAAMDTFGVSATDKTGLDAFNPTNKTELAEFTDALSKKISQYKHLDDYPGFLEELVRNLCVTCEYFCTIRQLVELHSTANNNFNWTPFCFRSEFE